MQRHWTSKIFFNLVKQFQFYMLASYIFIYMSLLFYFVFLVQSDSWESSSVKDESMVWTYSIFHWLRLYTAPLPQQGSLFGCCAANRLGRCVDWFFDISVVTVDAQCCDWWRSILRGGQPRAGGIMGNAPIGLVRESCQSYSQISHWCTFTEFSMASPTPLITSIRWPVNTNYYIQRVCFFI